MNQSIAERLPNSVVFDGRKYRLRLSVGRVLSCYEVLQEDAFSVKDKLELCLDLLVKNKIKLKKLGIAKKSELFEIIFSTMIAINRGSEVGSKCFDFLQDSQYLYAGFMQCYGIDLIDQSDTLHWWKFVSLFSGISNDTRIAQIIGIRSQPIPKATKYNAEERNRIIRLKHEYRLQMTDEERNANLQQGLSKIAKALGGMANRTK